MLFTLEILWISFMNLFRWLYLQSPFLYTWFSVSACCDEVLMKYKYIYSFLTFLDLHFAVIFYKWSVDWNSRMLSATCLDPDGDTWGSSAYKGEWIVCDGSGDGTCTPWGYSCTGVDDTAAKCSLNFGGSGDGCQVCRVFYTNPFFLFRPDCFSLMSFYLSFLCYLIT